MLQQINDIRAALLYLLYFQLQEAQITDEALPVSQAQSHLDQVKGQIIQAGYQDPESITWDNEGIPIGVTWQRPLNNSGSQFAIKVYEACQWNPYHLSFQAQ